MKIKKGITNILRGLNIFVIIGTLLAYLAAFVSPQTIWWLSLFGLAYPIFLFFNIAFILLFISLKSRVFILNLACVLLGWNYLTSFFQINTQNSEPTTTQQLKICSFNSHHYPNENTLTYFNEFSNDANAAVYCFQEHNYTNADINQIIENVAPYTFKGFISIFSKYPIINQGFVVGDGKGANGAIFADIKIDTYIFRIYNVHLKSTGIASDAQKIRDEKDLESDVTKNSVKNILRGLRNAGTMRAIQVDELVRHIEGSPYPVIVCGDFNDTPYSYTYHKIRNELKDSFVEKGNGLGITYNGPIPCLRIDYILTSPSLNFLSHKILTNTTLSDHYPIVAQISY